MGSTKSEVQAFVAGATGYTGREVVRELRRRAVETVAHVRPDSSRLEEYRARFGESGASVDATPWTLDAMTATMTRLRPTHVFALLGTTRARMKKEVAAGQARADYEKVDYGMSAMLIDAAIAAGVKPRYVYLSSLGVGPRSANAYIAVRWRLEEKLRASGLSYAIARPSIITGEDREDERTGEKIAAVVADSVLGAIGALGGKGLRDKWSSMNAETLARGLVRAGLDSSEDRIFESEALR